MWIKAILVRCPHTHTHTVILCVMCVILRNTSLFAHSIFYLEYTSTKREKRVFSSFNRVLKVNVIHLQYQCPYERSMLLLDS